MKRTLTTILLTVLMFSCANSHNQDKPKPVVGGSLPDSTTTQEDKKTVLQDLCWSPDGRSIYFSAMRVKRDFSDYSPKLWNIYRFDTQTKSVRVFIKSAVYVTISPSGKELAVARNIDKTRNIYIFDTNGVQIDPLVTGNSKMSTPAWSPDGNMLAFMSTMEGKEEIYTVKRDGSNVKRITFSQGHKAFNPAWSPNGKFIAYYLEKGDGRDQIYVVKPDGTENRNVTNDTLHNIFPGWIDNSTIIYSQGNSDRRIKAFQVSIDGNNKQQVLQIESMFVRYSPDGSKIAYIDAKEGVIRIVTAKGKLLHEITIPDAQTLHSSNPKLVGTCEGCEAVFEYGHKALTPVDTLPGFNDEGIKIKIEGTIYQPDGKTPAEGVILYVYHTNQDGIYENKYNKTNWEKRHGYIRGWVKTDSNGQYAFYTLKPGVYPDRSSPAHIHPTILEPNGKYYWLGSYHFEGDSLLTDKEINPDAPRGGSSGLLNLTKEKDILVGTRDIILGKNVPYYD